eukprot:191552_1
MVAQFTVFTLLSAIQLKYVIAVEYVDHGVTPTYLNFRLNPNDTIISTNQLTSLIMQGDGNLALFKRPNISVGWTGTYEIWASNTFNNGFMALLGWDGNLIVYDQSWAAQWNSGSWHGGNMAPNTLVVDNEGYAYIVTRTNDVIWQIGTANTITPSLTSLDPTCTFPILSIDSTNNNNGKYFNFDANTVDIMLGITTWNSNNFTVYNSRTSQFSKVILWRAQNGGSVGDAHGRKSFPDIAQDGDWALNDMLSVMALDYECYTESPTQSPTSNTASPTSNTASPSFMPTDFPSVSPTETSSTPTSSPTQQPSKQPSIIPIKSPTNVPTKIPTFSPAYIPTAAGQVLDIETTESRYDTTVEALADKNNSNLEMFPVFNVFSYFTIIIATVFILILMIGYAHAKCIQTNDFFKASAICAALFQVLDL